MPMERNRNIGRRNLSGPYTYACNYTAQNERCGIYGIFERQKCNNNFSEMGEYEVCIPQPRIWRKGYYVDTVGKNTAAIKEYIANQLKVDNETDQLSIFDPNDPLTGSK